MSQPCTATIVLPLYKPKGNWITQFIKDVREINARLSDERLQYIVVHDGPADAPLQSAFELLSEEIGAIQFIHYEENKGKGYALRQGVRAARSPYVLLIDFDFPYQTENICTILKELRAGKDVVVGRRKKAYFRQAPLKRMLVSKFFSTLNRIFIPLPHPDTQSGIKGFNLYGSNIFKETTINRFLVDTEFLMRVYKTNLTIGIVDIDLKPHVVFSSFGTKVITTELMNFCKIMYLSWQLPKRFIAKSEPVIKEVQTKRVPQTL